MLKLIKYEFRKQAFSKLVILVCIGALELFFCYGVIADKQNVLALSTLFFMLFTMGAMCFIAFESIITYSNDLNQKCSYMLFLTPNTTYSIVGAKVLTAGLQVILAGIVFLLIFAINGGILIARYDALEYVREQILKLLEQLFQLKIQWKEVISFTIASILSWINIITLAFFSITLSTTFLANKKFKGFVSFLIFLLLYVGMSKILKLVGDNFIDYRNMSNAFLCVGFVTFIFIVLTYIGTAWMLDKKVSV
ncbi:MAG: ABC transporter permease [Lachnoclostridium sp.]|jgi:ABC-2 type transport system permease protein